MRLTKKEIPYITSSSNIIEVPDIAEGYKYIGQAIDKLGQLENIEEELGIDLMTLFKALTNGLYGKFYLENGEPNIIFNSNKFNFIDKERKCFDSYFSPHPIRLYFKDYGKTWALTKEELL